MEKRTLIPRLSLLFYNTGPVCMWLTLGTLQKLQGKAIHRYEGSLQGFTDIKQVSGHRSQVCRGINAWNTFVLS